MLRLTKPLHLLLIATLLLAGCSSTAFKLNPYSLDTRAIPLPLGVDTIAFHDLGFDARIQRVIIPAAETGQLILMDPKSLGYQAIGGFSEKSPEGVVLGATSAVTARNLVYAIDHTAREIRVIDPGSDQIVSATGLESLPDYIRYVPSMNELWVTEPEAEQIEIFQPTLDVLGGLERTDVIEVEKGPENLVVDRRRGMAFTNQPETGTTSVYQVNTHGLIGQWGNGCSQARGMSVDEERGYLFVACAEGKLVVLDIENDGAQLTSQNYGGELDAVAYNPTLKHIYLPSGGSAILAVFAIQKGLPTPTPSPTPDTSAGSTASALTLKRLGTADTARGAHCVTFDDENNIWVCDPTKARIFVIKDTFPASDG